MSTIAQNIAAIRATIPENVQLVCVSKFHPAEAIMEAYNIGERDFGESRVQELCLKQSQLPADIRWHFIGHLQTNKVRQIVPFVHLIHSVDSIHLLETINAEAERIHRVVNILLEVHTANETTKSGFMPDELLNVKSAICNLKYPNVNVLGLMTMATNTTDETEIHRCFKQLPNLRSSIFNGDAILSMGMSDDYLLAIQDGSNMVRIGTDIFGSRQY